MSKEKVSSDYLARTKKKHAAKPAPRIRRILITGAGKPKSIGETIKKQIESRKPRLIKFDNFVGDVRNPGAIHKAFKQAPYTDLVLCHGITNLNWFEEESWGKLEEIVDVNLTSTMKLISAFVNDTVESPYHKTIVIIGSMAHRNVLNGSAAYCAAKAGLAMLARCLAWELAPKGYDVFCIHPSNTEGTPMTEDTIKGLMRYRKLTRKQAEAYWGATLPKGRWLNAGNIADLVEFLLSGKGEYLSGSQLELPGGQR